MLRECCWESRLRRVVNNLQKPTALAVGVHHEPLDLTEFVEQFEIDLETIEVGINELVTAEEFKIEWEQEKQIKLVPRMAKETVIHFAERVLSGIRIGKNEEGVEP